MDAKQFVRLEKKADRLAKRIEQEAKATREKLIVEVEALENEARDRKDYKRLKAKYEGKLND